MPRIQPDRAALEIAYSLMSTRLSLDELLKNPTQKRLLESRARKHMRSRNKFDIKKMQANDND